MRSTAAPVALLLLAACTTVPPVKHSAGTSQSPSAPWVAPSDAVPPVQAAETAALPPNVTPGATLSLAEAVDVALANNPQTRVAWLQARSAEAQLGSRQSQYLPEIDLGGNLATGAVASSNGSTTTAAEFGPSLTLNYLLFDFGGRAASVEEARQALIAADYLHNQAIQDVMLRTEQAYYDYLAAKALADAQTATVAERKKELDAADARHDAGVATVADVLQARTALSQAELNRETFAGQVRIAEGSLSTAMGLPPAARFDYGALPANVPARQITDSVDALIARAAAARPDLAAARASAIRAEARIREVRAEGQPSIGLTASAAPTWYSGGVNATPYSVGIGLRWPIFTGFRVQYDVRQAEIESQIAGENLRTAEQQADLQVWTSYFALQTAEQRVTTARDLLTSASQSADVARDRYRDGVGSILDLLTAEAALESARAQEVQARADWFLSVAQLAHDTGSLGR